MTESTHSDLGVKLRPEVNPDAFDVIGSNGLVLELTRNKHGGYYLHGISGQSVSGLNGIYLGQTPFTRWLDDRIADINGPLPGATATDVEVGDAR